MDGGRTSVPMFFPLEGGTGKVWPAHCRNLCKGAAISMSWVVHQSLHLYTSTIIWWISNAESRFEQQSLSFPVPLLRRAKVITLHPMLIIRALHHAILGSHEWRIPRKRRTSSYDDRWKRSCQLLSGSTIIIVSNCAQIVAWTTNRRVGLPEQRNYRMWGSTTDQDSISCIIIISVCTTIYMELWMRWAPCNKRSWCGRLGDGESRRTVCMTYLNVYTINLTWYFRRIISFGHVSVYEYYCQHSYYKSTRIYVCTHK